MPVCQNLIGGLCKFRVRPRQGRIDHRQFMRICPDRLDVAAHRDPAIRRSDELGTQPLLHGLNTPVLPKEGMPTSRAKVGNLERFQCLQSLDLLPKTGHRPCIQDLKLELPHALQNRARSQFHQHGKGRDLPHHDFGPFAFEGQFILPIAPLQVIGRQAHRFEPFHEIGTEHLALAVEHVPAQPGAFAARK